MLWRVQDFKKKERKSPLYYQYYWWKVTLIFFLTLKYLKKIHGTDELVASPGRLNKIHFFSFSWIEQSLRGAAAANPQSSSAC